MVDELDINLMVVDNAQDNRMMNLKYKKKNHLQMNSRMNNRLNKTFCSMIILSLRSGYIYRKRERDWIDNDS